MIKFKSSLIVVLAILTTFFSLYMVVMLIPNAYASENNDSLIMMTEQRTFRDSDGNLNIIAVVDNNGQIPVGITVGLNTTGRDGSRSASGDTTITTIRQPIFGRIIYPFAGAPFKFVVGPERSVIGKAFITNIHQIPVPYYNL